MKKKNLHVLLGIGQVFLLSFLTFGTAEAAPIVANIVREIINPLIQLLLGAGLIVFLWGMVEFMSALEDDGKRSDGKRHMIWGVIGLAIMVSVFAIISIIQSTVNGFR